MNSIVLLINDVVDDDDVKDFLKCQKSFKL